MAVPDNLQSREDWNRRVEREIVLAAFGQWRFSVARHGRLIARTREIFAFPLIDRDPVEGWSFGRVTLAGGATHPMQPIGLQAGSQAIIDSRALAADLMATADPAQAFAVLR